MPSYTIEVFQKKPSADALAHAIKTELIEAGQPEKAASVLTRKLYRVSGELNLDQVEIIANTLLVDPVIESFAVESFDGKSPKKKKTGGIVLDVWPKAGVTDPVAETVEKGIRDLGHKLNVRAAHGARYLFPNVSDTSLVKRLASDFLANELIHDIDIRQTN